MVHPGAGSERSAKTSSFALAGLSALINKSPVCTENLILIDYVTESPNVNGVRTCHQS